jgi:hypothetical protein
MLPSKPRTTVCVHQTCALRNVCAVHITAGPATVENPREIRPHLASFRCPDFIERKRSDA